MNRSIAKTRNQLERITFKINQLKTKYTGDNFNPGSTGAQNSPLSHSQYRQKQFTDNRPREPMVSNYQNKFAQPTPTKSSTPSIISVSNDDAYQKQFKVFRNQMYNYIDKCLLLSKQREQQLIEKTIQTQMQNSRNIVRGKSNMEERIKKIQQQTTNCITNIQDAIVQIKKNQKHFGDKINNLQVKLRRQIKQNGDKNKSYDIFNGEEMIKKLQAIQKQHQLLKQDISKNEKNAGKSDQLIQEVGVKIENVEKRINKKFTDFQSSQQEYITIRYDSLHQKIENYNKFNVMLQKQILQLKTKSDSTQQFANQTQKIQQNIINKMKQMMDMELQQHINILNQTLQKNCADIGSVAESVLELEHRVEQIVLQKTAEVKRKSSQKNYEMTAEKQKAQIIQYLQQTLTNQIKVSVQSSYLKPRLEQFKREFSTKINQQIELGKQDILITVEQSIFEKVNKLMAQQYKRKSPKSEIDQIGVVSTQNIKELQNKLKAFIFEQIDSKFPRNIIKLETAQTQQNDRRQKTSPNQPKQVEQQSLDHRIIQQKLNQFQNDINQTIKLLYQDIENKVNQMMSHSGLMDFRVEFEDTKKNIIELQTKVKSLTLLITSHNQNQIKDNQTNETHKIRTFQQKLKPFEHLREQVYSDMGMQIDKLSNILERTYQQIQTKVQKLDRNFSYVYQRMSSIQYDNANFKDKLTSLLQGGRPSPFRPYKKEEPQLKSQSSGSNLLDVLGQLSTGRQFFGQN